MTKTTRRPGRAQSGDRLRREPGIGWLGQPDDAVEVAEHGAHGRRGRHGRHRRTRRVDQCQPGRVPRFEPFPALRYATVDLDAVDRPAVRRAVRRRRRRPRGTRRAQHRPRRRPARADGADRYDGAGRAAADVDRRRACWSPTSSRRSRSTGCASPTPPAPTATSSAWSAGCEVVDEGAGGVLPHERTTPKASTDRLDLTRATRCQPVAGLGAVARRRADRPAPPSRPSRWASVTVDGVEHVVERVTDPERIAAIRDAPRPATTCSSPTATTATASPAPTATRCAATTGRQRHAGRADAGVRRRARRRAAQRRGDPPRSTPGVGFDELRDRARRVVRPRRPPDRRRCRRRWREMGERGALVLVDADGSAELADPPTRRVRRRPRPRRRVARARPRATSASTSPTSTASTRCSPRSRSGAADGRRADPAGRASPRSSAPRARAC